MSNRVGDNDEWAFRESDGQQTRESPGVGADAGPGGPQGAGGPQGPGGPPSPSSRRAVVLVLAGALMGALVVGALGIAGFLLVDRDSQVETTTAGSSESADGPDASDPAAGETPGDAEGQSSTAATSSIASSPSSTAESATTEPSPAAPPPVAPGGPELAPAGGAYSGVLSQRGSRQSDQDFPVEMYFSSTGSAVNYPTLGCSGSLSPLGNSGRARVYREDIASGECEPTGTWYVTRGSNDEISAEYRPARGDYVVLGQLTR